MRLDVDPIIVDGPATFDVRQEAGFLPTFDGAEGFLESCREFGLGNERVG